MTKSTGAREAMASKLAKQREHVLEVVKKSEPVSCNAVAKAVGIGKTKCYKMLKEHAENRLIVLIGRTDGARWCVYGSPACEKAQEKYDRIRANRRNMMRRKRYESQPLDRAFVHRIIPADQVRVHRPKHAVASVFELGAGE